MDSLTKDLSSSDSAHRAQRQSQSLLDGQDRLTGMCPCHRFVNPSAAELSNSQFQLFAFLGALEDVHRPSS